MQYKIFMLNKAFNINTVSRELVIAMLKEEQVVRYSKEIQEIYTEEYFISKNEGYRRVNIEAEIQKYILKKFGFSDTLESLEEYWKIPSTYWHDEEVKNSIFYMKLNIFQYPNVKLNDNLINVPLVSYPDEKTIQLNELQRCGKPLVILAGSMT